MPLSLFRFFRWTRGDPQNAKYSFGGNRRHNRDFGRLIGGDVNIALRGGEPRKLVGPKFVFARRQVDLEFAVVVGHSFEGSSRVLNCDLYLGYRHSCRIEDRPLEPRRRLLSQNQERAKRQSNKR